MKTEAVSNKWHKDGVLLLSRDQYFCIRDMFFRVLYNLDLYEYTLYKKLNVCDNLNEFETGCYNIMPKDCKDAVCSICSDR